MVSQYDSENIVRRVCSSSHALLSYWSPLFDTTALCFAQDI